MIDPCSSSEKTEASIIRLRVFTRYDLPEALESSSLERAHDCWLLTIKPEEMAMKQG
jgi:hypothetical protein